MLSYCSVQTVGLGGLHHNTVMLGWPNEWHRSADSSSWKMFIGEWVQQTETNSNIQSHFPVTFRQCPPSQLLSRSPHSAHANSTSTFSAIIIHHFRISLTGLNLTQLFLDFLIAVGLIFRIFYTLLVDFSRLSVFVSSFSIVFLMSVR